jgi:hypothetical protein
MNVDRRALMLGACAAACTPSPNVGLGGGALSTGVVDAHAHLFNASDLSIEQFVSIVVFKNYREEDMPDEECRGPHKGKAIARIIRRAAHALAPTGDQELAEIGAPISEQPTADRDALDRYGVEAGSEIDEMRLGGGGFDNPDGEFLGEFEREVRDVAQQSNFDPPSDTDEQVKLLVREADASQRRNVGREIGRYLAWGYWLTRSRDRIIRRYKTLYPGVSQIVALQVDYEKWLGEEPRTPFAKQLDVMQRLRQGPRGHRELQIFAPFCPLREALARHGDGWSPLQRLQEDWRLGRSAETVDRCDLRPSQNSDSQRATVHRRFAAGGAMANEIRLHGVKLYPPMGFRPIGNVELAPELFPRDVVDRWRGAGQSPSTLGRELDAALDDFFAWAQCNDVPIVTHSGNSVDAGCRFAQRGDPLLWERRLKAGYGDLRLSLGHFDQFDLFTANQQTSWGGVKARLVREYPNVYTDLSYMEEVVRWPKAQAQAFFNALAAVDTTCTRFLYGTDWIMFDREPDPGSYHDRIKAMFDDAPFAAGAFERFHSGNGRSFLKLAA